MFALAIARARAADERRALDEIVVTAPPVHDAAAAEDPTAFATVVDTTAAPSEVTTLAEALADTAGVQVRRFGGLGDFSAVSIRGSSAGQVQVYLDGVPLSRADSEAVNLSDLPLDAVERVEVYRGATPLAFAQSAPGGVVNVVTRRVGEVPLTAASTSYGSFDTRKVDLARGARVGPWDYLAFADYLGSTGDFVFTNDLGTTANPADDRRERRQNDAFDAGGFTTRLGYRPGEPFSAMLTSDTFVKEAGVPGVGNFQTRDASLSTLRQLAHLDLDLRPAGHPALDATAKGWIVYDQQAFTDRRGEVALVPEDTETRSTALGAQTLVRTALGTHQAPGLLLALADERFATEDRLRAGPAVPDRTRLRGTVAVEDEIAFLAERLAIVPAVRWEVFRDDFPGVSGLAGGLGLGGVEVRDFTSPRLGVRAEAGHGVTFLGNIGRYARVPNLSELFGDQGTLVGNPKLRPEVALDRDVGLRWMLPSLRWLARPALEYAFFTNTIDDLIVLVPSLRTVRPENVTSAAVEGHEVTARARLADRFDFAMNYTHQRARDTGDVTYLRGKQLPGRPADEAFVHLDFGWSAAHPLPLGHAAARLWPGRLFYEADIVADNFLDRANLRRVGSRVLHDVGLELVVPVRPLRLVLEAKNVGDDRTRDVLGFPLPGRAFFVTLAYGFGRLGGPDARP